MTTDTPRKLGKYEIRGRLGRGAMGIVYDGFDPVIERRVAIKTIAKASMDPDEAAEVLGRFKREAQAAGRLNHPGIVSIHDYGEDDGLAFIAMEFIRGHELRKYFESRQRFALAHIVRIMGEILDALDHAHRNGVVHRDIKPSNIMITDEGRVKVADFGVAWIESSTMTQVGMRIGTPAYMSPEQHQGLPVSGRSDLFSAGVILYQFLTGERPFTGGGYPLIRQILLDDPIPPSERNPEIPRSLDAVTLKALAKHPEHRFATAREFAEAIRKAATGDVVGKGVALMRSDEALPVDAWATTLRPDSGGGASDATRATGGGISNPSAVSLEAELEYWKEIKDSTEPADFETFLQAFPESRFAPLARRRLARLRTDANAGARAQREAAGQAPIEAEQPLAGAAAEDLRQAEDGERYNGAHARKLEPPKETSAAEPMPVLDFLLDAQVEPAASAPEPARMKGVIGRPVHARRRIEPIYEEAGPVEPIPASLDAEGAPIPASSAPAQPLAPGTTRKPLRVPIAAALAALLVGSGVWYAAAPQSSPIVAALRTQAQSVFAHFQGEWPAQAQEQRTHAGTVRPAPAQRDDAEALEAARERQLALEREKQQAAKRAEANRKYQRALELLAQGRSSEAVRALRELAYDGHGPAAKTLGDLYASGEDVLLDMQEAARFYALAERNGVKIDGPAFVDR